ncbi:PucR family transcriptional regulator [Spirillospora sp. NPDC047279]|uniref:PucR family transcriptional regulator n=1 Tax=Spirillospora sp. NPDC047279 TaxID=3155478 RepID=UPI0033CD39B3
MPPTLSAVAALPHLGLRALTAVEADRPVRWVAVSELEDPTPFLEGGELVLVTGMRITSGNAAAYVARLVERKVAGLGFAVGIIHEAVPPELVEAARDQGLTLLEVPEPVPFIAVGKAVSRLLAAEWYEDVTRAFQAQRELTRAALRGPGPLITRLARELGGWALLLDASGEVRYAEPARARRRAAGLLPDLARLARDDRTASISLSGRDDHVVAQGVGLTGHPRAFLAVGTAEPLPHVAHTIVGSAVALLTLQSESPRTTRDLRAALGALLLGLQPGAATLPDSPVRVLACAGGSAVADALADDDRVLAVSMPGQVLVIVPDAQADQVMALAHQSGPVGASDAFDLGEATADRTFQRAETALRQAERALAAARRKRAALRHADLPGQSLLGILDPEAAQGFADALLGPLAADPTLVTSLRAYITANGQGETAARALGVHRHTLRTRIQKAARLLDRDLDDPAVRAELWIALSVTANGTGRIGHPGH